MTFTKINYLGREIEIASTSEILKHMLGETDHYPSKKNCFVCNLNTRKYMTKRYYPDDLEWFGYEGQLEFYLAEKREKEFGPPKPEKIYLKRHNLRLK